MILYYSPLSNYCSKVKFLIDYKDIEVALIPPPGGYGSDIFKKISPLGSIPALKHNNMILHESEIINEYLNELYPDPPMLTNDIELNAKIRMISRFHDTKLEPSIRSFFKYKKKTKYNYNDIVKDFANVERQLKIFNTIINDTKYIAKDEITLADCSFPSWFALFDIFCNHFKRQITLKDKIENYYKNLLNDKFMRNQYNVYYQNALKWSKESLIEN
jgi:glutathione S-transferase